MPSKLSFRDAVATFRADDPAESALVLIGKGGLETALRRIFIAWPRTPPRPKSAAAQPFPDGPDLWDRLWAAVEIDHEGLRRATGMPGELTKYLDILICNRLIYPDGTVSEIGTQVLRRMAKSALNLK